jgi:glycosyltransferase involved in cell wall biosynthesis
LKPLLFLSPRVPEPLNTGAKLRTRALLTALTRAFDGHYLGFRQPELPEKEARRALGECRAVRLWPEPATGRVGRLLLALRNLADTRPVSVAKYWQTSLAAAVRQWGVEHPRSPAHADHIHMAPYLNLIDGPRVIDEHNVEAAILERMVEHYRPGGPLGRLLAPVARAWLGRQAARMIGLESDLVGKAQLVLAVSGEDAARLRKDQPSANTLVVPNGVDVNYFTPSPESTPPESGQLVFTGSMDWFPNQDAIVYFCREILPLLERDHAGVDWRLDVVGHRPPAAVQALAGPRVHITGSVPDVRSFAWRARTFVVPLRIGGGSRLKILEAFAMGIPVVSTGVGCEGLAVEHGTHLLIADTPGEFAEALARTDGDAGLRKELTTRAAAFALERHTWAAIGEELVRTYRREFGLNETCL